MVCKVPQGASSTTIYVNAPYLDVSIARFVMGLVLPQEPAYKTVVRDIHNWSSWYINIQY